MLTLAAAPVGTPFTLASTDVERPQARRLATMGMRVGAPLRVLGKTAGGGRIVDVAGSRIALDRGVAAQLFVR